jgi:predicted RecB family nuclease
MPGVTVSLPVLSPGRPMRLTPTDVTQFVRLEQCERYLRFRLTERAGHDFMGEYDVTPQRITPLLSLSGQTFEDGIETDLARRFHTVNFAAKHGKAHNRPDNNAEIVQEARKLPPGQTALLFQTRLEADLGGWLLRGDVDLLRLAKTPFGTLHVFIGDMKSTVEVKVEHRLQVAFYRLMLERVLKDASLTHATVQTGICSVEILARGSEEHEVVG